MIHDSGTFEGWIPADFLDEIVPERRSTPDDWLVRGDVLRLASLHEAFGDHPAAWFDAGEPDCVGKLVSEGDVVKFEGLTTFGAIRVRIDGGEHYQALDPVPDCNCFTLAGDVDTLAHTLSNFVKDNGDTFDPGEIVEVDCYDWTSRDFVLRGGVFVPVAPQVGNS